jgi:homeobox protein cut-like
MKQGTLQSSYLLSYYRRPAREQDLLRQVSLLKDQLRDLRMSNESTEARLLDQSQRLGMVSLCSNFLS